MDKAFPGVRYVLDAPTSSGSSGSGFWRDADADEARALIERVVEIQERLRATRPDRVFDVRYEELTGPDPDARDDVVRRLGLFVTGAPVARAVLERGARGARHRTRPVPVRAVTTPTRVTPMSRRLVLHVGAMKSGTSFIQSRLFANKTMLLDERGILVPGMNWLSQVMAASDVLGSGEAQWAKMAGKVNAHTTARR